MWNPFRLCIVSAADIETIMLIVQTLYVVYSCEGCIKTLEFMDSLLAAYIMFIDVA